MHILGLRSCLFCEGRISVLKRWFKTPIQNALHGSTVHASLEKKTISWACTAHCSRLLFELKWTGKAFIWRHLSVVICDFAFMLPPESAFCSNHDRKRTFLGVLKRRLFENKHGQATAFCSNHVWKRWFWPQKLSMNAPRFESAFWNAVYSKSAFWNAVYSKISMDATAFCSNHVWKRWFWPQKLSINAPLVTAAVVGVNKNDLFVGNLMLYLNCIV